MTGDLDNTLRAVRDEARGYAGDLRDRALALDAAPDGPAAHLDSPGMRGIIRLQPSAMGNLAATVALVELAQGDAAAVLACPGPALAGVLVRILGDDEQRERLAAAVADGRTWGYLAVTEPGVGSDVPRLHTELRPDGAGGYQLHGAKRYIGNGARGTVGVVLARTGPSPLALRAALVFGPQHAEPLNMIGLRGAQISEMTFDGVPVGGSDLLGGHLPALRRGMWGLSQAFNTVRVHVAAMAVGTALGVHAYVRSQRRGWSAWNLAELDAAAARLAALRALVYRTAREVDADRQAGHRAALAKLAAVEACRELASTLPRLLGRGAMLEHPLLEKWWRDSAAFEFMEGTGHIQRLHVAQGLLTGAGRAH